MQKRWCFHPHDSARIAQIEQQAGVPPIVAQLLLCRGVYEPTAVRTFLDARLSGLRDPAELPGLNEAADRLFAAAKAGRKIFVYGDYDADGMTATALLLTCLRRIGADASHYIPNRLEDGYGLNGDALRSLAQRGASVVVSVDCGIASIAEAELCRELGLELIITDHHELADQLPCAAAIVHPRLPGSQYPFSGLCGAAVAFKLAWGLCQRASGAQKVTDSLREFLLAAVGLAALGTVADMVPLLDENRILVRHGLESIRQYAPPGLAALMRVTGLDKKPQLTSEDLAFTLAPRLNAAGRLGQAELGVELLVTDKPARAQALAEYIHELNNSRDSLERSVYLAAMKQVKEEFDPENDPALVLAGRGWHPGVIGIVAGRIAEKFHRPTILIAYDQMNLKPGTGSARSAGTICLHTALANCTEHLLGHGGHSAAAGLKIEETKLEAFRHAFCEHAAAEIGAGKCAPEVRIDAEGPLSQLTLQTVRQIEQLAPFGCGNPRPVLCATRVRLAEPPKRIGGGERHLSLKLIQHDIRMRAVGFGFGERAEELAQLERPLDIAYRPVINDFRGQQSVEAQIVDWRVSEA